MAKKPLSYAAGGDEEGSGEPKGGATPQNSPLIVQVPYCPACLRAIYVPLTPAIRSNPLAPQPIVCPDCNWVGDITLFKVQG